MNGELFQRSKAKEGKDHGEYQTKLYSVPSGGTTDRDMDKKPILDVRELGIDFGGLTAVDGFNLMIGRNEITGHSRPQRCR